jgi:hypothetical protein
LVGRGKRTSLEGLLEKAFDVVPGYFVRVPVEDVPGELAELMNEVALSKQHKLLYAPEALLE